MTAVVAAAAAPAGAGTARRPTRVAPGLSRTVAPALLVAAGYVDPGNWGTDVAAGAQFGYRLVWVLAAATGLALFLQHLSARLGFATGRDLATLLRERLPRAARGLVFPPLLVALAVTEVVEVLGVVIGVQLLTGWSTGWSVLLATVLVLTVFAVPAGLARRAVYGCLALVGGVYLAVLVLHGGGEVVRGLAPGPLPPGGLPVAVALIGAVVMPHNILLHSALARDLREQAGSPGRSELRRLQRASMLTTGAALAVAFAVNCAIMSVAAPAGAGDAVPGLAGALQAAPPTFGAVTTSLFAVTLIGAGLASSVTGGMVGADVLRCLLPGLRVHDVVRRVLCLAPATVVVVSGLPEVQVLVWSQVVLTLVPAPRAGPAAGVQQSARGHGRRRPVPPGAVRRGGGDGGVVRGRRRLPVRVTGLGHLSFRPPATGGRRHGRRHPPHHRVARSRLGCPVQRLDVQQLGGGHVPHAGRRVAVAGEGQPAVPRVGLVARGAP